MDERERERKNRSEERKRYCDRVTDWKLREKRKKCGERE